MQVLNAITMPAGQQTALSRKYTSYRAGSWALFWIFFLGLLMPACQPAVPEDKVAYLSRFESFIHSVEGNCNQITVAELDSLERVYRKYSREWYRKFYPELSQAERLQVWNYRRRYLACTLSLKLKRKGGEFFRELEDFIL